MRPNIILILLMEGAGQWKFECRSHLSHWPDFGHAGSEQTLLHLYIYI